MTEVESFEAVNIDLVKLATPNEGKRPGNLELASCDRVIKRPKLHTPESNESSADSSFQKIEVQENGENGEAGEDGEAGAAVETEGLDKRLTKKQVEKIERMKKRELERQEKERKRELERARKEEERKAKEEERRKKMEAKEKEKEMRQMKLEEKRQEEKLEKERKKEEERARKQAEKEEKERIRMEKKRKLEEERELKEQEKRRIEEEKRRAEEMKERSQKKISSFFSIGPKVAKESKRQELQGGDGDGVTAAASTASASESNCHETSLYNKVFLPFFQKKNVTIALSGQLPKDLLILSKQKFDSGLDQQKPDSNDTDNLLTFLRKHQYSEIETGQTFVTPETIMNALNSSHTSEAQIYDMFAHLGPIKYLQFYENSKPPYIGTWCSAKHMATNFPKQNPLDTTTSGLDYSYDSDAEWNDDDGEGEGEGEDIDNDDDNDDDEDVDDDDEMDDFVEANEAVKRKKKFVGPLVATSKWNDGSDHQFFSNFKYELLDLDIQISIDPQTNYWNSTKLSLGLVNDDHTNTNKCSSRTQPTTLNHQQNLEGTAPTSSTQLTHPTQPFHNVLIARKPTITDEKALANLITFVESNNEFTIGTLVELSKKEFPAFTKSLLKHTIQTIASYNKKTGNWEIKDDVKNQLHRHS